MPQEIRNCVYQGNLNSLLFELNKNKNWRTLFGREQEDPRMRDLEFILRYLSLKAEEIRKFPKSAISLKKYLNEFMGSKQNNELITIAKFRNDFNNAVSNILEIFGENAFYNVQSTDLTTIRKRFYPTIFDAVMIATTIAVEKGVDIRQSSEQKRLELLKNPDFRKFISEGTMQVEHINGRINLALSYLYDTSL